MSIDLKVLFERHEREVGQFLRRRLGNATDAADISQEAFLRVAGMKEGRSIADPRGFLFTVAANLARDHLRRLIRGRKVEVEPSGQDAICTAATPEEALLARQRDHVLRDAIDSLPEKTRAVFLLYHVETLSYREIAERLAISPRTVEYHLREALSRCRDHAQRCGAL
ncbi:RNA polymerase sigma factor [Bosea sp. (in: a-proteobacteria)]|jgi:RNA polymerase sigma factor (sigma-70 family)|uniref:RNA polymerase sigma factor n=1 Tax=Bosea sp. (in: a-proteobacteria) TaxID=1871050 RepID=UPI003F6F8E9A